MIQQIYLLFKLATMHETLSELPFSLARFDICLEIQRSNVSSDGQQLQHQISIASQMNSNKKEVTTRLPTCKLFLTILHLRQNMRHVKELRKRTNIPISQRIKPTGFTHVFTRTNLATKSLVIVSQIPSLAMTKNISSSPTHMTNKNRLMRI